MYDGLRIVLLKYTMYQDFRYTLAHAQTSVYLALLLGLGTRLWVQVTNDWVLYISIEYRVLDAETGTMCDTQYLFLLGSQYLYFFLLADISCLRLPLSGGVMSH